LLSNRKIQFALFVLISLVLYSCGGKGSKTNEKPQLNLSTPEDVMNQAKAAIGNDVKFASKGNFDRDSVNEVAVGTEEEGPKNAGIKFILLKEEDGKLVQTFSTSLMQGSFKQSLAKKIKFPAFSYELVYYNSQDYFLGSGGGEIYSYIINYNESKAYYAHLVLQPGSPIDLYLSENIDVPEIKNFFIAIFKKDYPGLNVVSKDVVLKY
jgi:hypothetical protein